MYASTVFVSPVVSPSTFPTKASVVVMMSPSSGLMTKA
jgi:hypothetical protein